MAMPHAHKPFNRTRRRLLVEQLERRELLASLPAGFAEAMVAAGLTNATAMELAPGGDVWVLEQSCQAVRIRKHDG
jgi:hypothetical protein